MAKKLHFGVRGDLAYTYGPSRTTGEVADFLEAKYGVIERFVTDNERAIRAILKEQTGRDVHAMVKGRTPSLQPALAEFKKMFRSYILTKQLDGRVRGVPTKASLLGINHRLKHPYAKANKPRQSFFDTGLYLSSFKAWVE